MTFFLIFDLASYRIYGGYTLDDPFIHISPCDTNYLTRIIMIKWENCLILNTHFVALRFEILPVKLTNTNQSLCNKFLLLLAKNGKVTPSQMGFITTECRALVGIRKSLKCSLHRQVLFSFGSWVILEQHSPHPGVRPVIEALTNHKSLCMNVGGGLISRTLYTQTGPSPPTTL